MKAITPVVATITLLLITISIIGIALVFFGRSTEQAGSEASKAIGQQLTQLGTDFKIDYTTGNKVYIRNTGSVAITNTSLGFYVNDQPVSAVSQVASIQPDQVVEFTINVPPGAYEVKVTAGVKEERANTFISGATTTTSTITTTTTTTLPPAVIMFDAASSEGYTDTSTLTWSHTVGSGASILLVGVNIRDSAIAATGVTYNGIPLTRIGNAFTGSTRIELWYLVNPSPGTNNVAVTLPSSVRIAAGAASWINVDQSNPLGTFVSATGNSATASVNVASAAGEIVVDMIGESTGASNPTANVGAGQTELWKRSDASTVSGGSREPGVASVTMSWSLSVSGGWAIGVVPLRPIGAATTTTTTTTLAVTTTTTMTPAIIFVSPTPVNGTYAVSYVYVNASVTDADSNIDACRLEWNSVNETMSKNATNSRNIHCFANKTGLANANYTYRVFANDTANNTNASATRHANIAVTTTTTTTTTLAPTTTTTTTTTSSTTTTTTCVTVTGYQDSDGDGYGVGAAQTFCDSLPAGYVSNNQDCYDSNANAKPGQTSYFTTNRGDGSFDYNCNGLEDKDPTINCLTNGPSSCATGTGVHAGYQGSVPPCGSSGTWVAVDKYNSVTCDIDFWVSWSTNCQTSLSCSGSARCWNAIPESKTMKCR